MVTVRINGRFFIIICNKVCNTWWWPFFLQKENLSISWRVHLHEMKKECHFFRRVERYKRYLEKLHSANLLPSFRVVDIYHLDSRLVVFERKRREKNCRLLLQMSPTILQIFLSWKTVYYLITQSKWILVSVSQTR